MHNEKLCLEAYLTGLISADGGLYKSRRGCKTDFVADSSEEFCKTIKIIVQKVFELKEEKIYIRKHKTANCFYVQSFSKNIIKIMDK